MNKLDYLYKKAMSTAKNRYTRELWEHGEELMKVWVDVMTYCYEHGIPVPDDRGTKERVFRETCTKCNRKEIADRFIDWYFDEDNECVFITRDYGDGKVEYGY